MTLTFQVTASLLQPVVGLYTDRRPQPYSLPLSMGCTLLGIVTLAFAPSFPVLLAGGALLGLGSAIFHPESSRVARLASGGAHGLAQSFFQVGGNVGHALGPLLAAFVILPRGQSSLAWFALVGLVGMALLAVLGRWYKSAGHARPTASRSSVGHATLQRSQVRRAIAVLIALIFSKFFYQMPGRVGMVSGLFFESPSEWAASEPRCWACSPTGPASSSFTTYVPFYRRSACLQSSFQTWMAGGPSLR